MDEESQSWGYFASSKLNHKALYMWMWEKNRERNIPFTGRFWQLNFNLCIALSSLWFSLACNYYVNEKINGFFLILFFYALEIEWGASATTI